MRRAVNNILGILLILAVFGTPCVYAIQDSNLTPETYKESILYEKLHDGKYDDTPFTTEAMTEILTETFDNYEEVEYSGYDDVYNITLDHETSDTVRCYIIARQNPDGRILGEASGWFNLYRSLYSDISSDLKIDGNTNNTLIFYLDTGELFMQIENGSLENAYSEEWI